MTVHERRAWPRKIGSVEERLPSARIKPGHKVEVLNISNGGALIEAETRLLPAATVDLRFPGSRLSIPIRARIVRCYVSVVEPKRMCYRAGVVFERHVDPFEVRRHGSG